jgi:type IV pilus assembly protein PilW
MIVGQRLRIAFSRQSGFSIVELMVALLLGSLLTLAAVQLFSVNQRTFSLQRVMNDVQEQGRFVLDFIARDLRQTGFADPDVGLPFPVGVLTDSVTLGTVTITPAAEGGSGALASDTLRVAFHGREDCDGDTSVMRTWIVNSYQLTADGNLVCVGSLPPASSAAMAEDVSDLSNGVVLLTGVDSFQVLYGVDDNEDGVAAVSQYVTADGIAGRPVLAIRIGILLRSDDASLTQLGDTARNFTVLDKELVGGVAPLEQQALRRLFVTTVKVRNVDPDLI